mmetsp:Transcript_47149/g.135055  ORF Transcript_47149/g.135055 Transcript_47149/m.135055 type:complete len:103 (-) Transcript_47149:1493-1801(-)
MPGCAERFVMSDRNQDRLEPVTLLIAHKGRAVEVIIEQKWLAQIHIITKMKTSMRTPKEKARNDVICSSTSSTKSTPKSPQSWGCHSGPDDMMTNLPQHSTM